MQSRLDKSIQINQLDWAVTKIDEKDEKGRCIYVLEGLDIGGTAPYFCKVYSKSSESNGKFDRCDEIKDDGKLDLNKILAVCGIGGSPHILTMKIPKKILDNGILSKTEEITSSALKSAGEVTAKLEEHIKQVVFDSSPSICRFM